jgi:glucosamine kinase
MTAKKIVVGLDGGGTYTRVLCADLEGRALAYIQAGGANPRKNAEAEQTVRAAIKEALWSAGVQPEQVGGMVAGISGLNSPQDVAWATRFTTLPGVSVPPYCVNDAVAAWAGALGLQPGIIAIGGTGSIVLGVTESGRRVRNYDFRHYGDLRARDVVLEVVYQIIIGATQPADRDLVAQVLAYFEVADVAVLAKLVSTCEDLEHEQFVAHYSGLAPLITEAAWDQVPVARRVCDAAGESLALGIYLVGSQFETDPVKTALIGGVARSAYIQTHLRDRLGRKANKAYSLVTPALPPEAGAVLMALERCGISPSQALVERLKITAQKVGCVAIS